MLFPYILVFTGGLHYVLFLNVLFPLIRSWCYRHFRFKSWYGPAIRVQTLNGLMEINSLTVNDLTREHSRKCECREGIQKREPRQNIHQLSSWLELYSSVFL